MKGGYPFLLPGLLGALVAGLQLPRDAPEGSATLPPASRRTKVAPRLPATGPQDRPGDAHHRELDGTMSGAEIAAMMRERLMEGLLWREKELTPVLALRRDQLDDLAKWRDEVSARMAKESDWLAVREVGSSCNQRAYDRYLESQLEGAQTRVFDEFRSAERERVRDAALESCLAPFPGREGMGTRRLDLLRATLMEEAGAVADFRVNDPRPVEFFHSSFDRDPHALGIEALVWEHLGDRIGMPDGARPEVEDFRREVRAVIESRLEKVGPLLDAVQLEAYRARLESGWSDPWTMMALAPRDPPVATPGQVSN
ncbi:hypothetical protein [Luteolibacter marinus]|uniref:hypothetical protein n=1 Tax=Luteolibacter marinus TaxID=2776705 RepID=UPI0018669498|nr:hypothetical protein [Luteolibacter marinus]